MMNKMTKIIGALAVLYTANAETKKPKVYIYSCKDSPSLNIENSMG